MEDAVSNGIDVDPYGSSSRSVSRKLAIERLVRSDPRRLCDEAKVETCRAMRDVRSCGRAVRSILEECGHAVLCGECAQRAECCPVCRVPIAQPQEVDEPTLLRLYDLCEDAELISDAGEGSDDAQHQPWTEDVTRLYTFFDIALQENLAVLVCHYVEEVCLDDNAVSSDAVISKLLDGTVVVEWCRAKLKAQKKELGKLYSVLGVGSMGRRMQEINRLKCRMEGVIYVLESLASSAKDDFSPVGQLLEFARRTVQHARLMMWCMKNRFLEDHPTRFRSPLDWVAAVDERKRAANRRQWPAAQAADGTFLPKDLATLFIQDAVEQLDLNEDDDSEWFEDLYQSRTGDRRGVSGVSAGGLGDVYPFPSVHFAVDTLLLGGSSDDEEAKKAIFLYYLFDRFWGTPQSNWSDIVDNYCLFFGITRQSRIESFVFFLLDETSEKALQEACRSVPEIFGPSLHPKVLSTLVERGAAHVALDALRASGNGGLLGGGAAKPPPVPLSKAIITLRVLLQSGHLCDGYLYQNEHWRRTREREEVNDAQGGQRNQVERATGASQQGNQEDEEERAMAKEGPHLGWRKEMGVLVIEICIICVREGWLGNLIKLPWSREEEVPLSRHLMNEAAREPDGKAGNFLVAYYVLRCCYMEAEKVHAELLELEQEYIEMNPAGADVDLMQEASQRRTKIVEACRSLVPEVERQQFNENNTRLERKDADQEIFASSPSTLGLVQQVSGGDVSSAEAMNISPGMSSFLPNLYDPSPLLRPDVAGDRSVAAKLLFADAQHANWQRDGVRPASVRAASTSVEVGGMGAESGYGVRSWQLPLADKSIGDEDANIEGEGWAPRALDFESPVRLLASGAGSPYVNLSRAGVSSHGWQQSDSGGERASGGMAGVRRRHGAGMTSLSSPSTMWVNTSFGSPGSTPLRRQTPFTRTPGMAAPQYVSRTTPPSIERFNTPIMNPALSSLGFQALSPASYISPLGKPSPIASGAVFAPSFQMTKKVENRGNSPDMEIDGGKDRWRTEQDDDEEGGQDDALVFTTPRTSFKSPVSRVSSIRRSRPQQRRTAAGYV